MNEMALNPFVSPFTALEKLGISLPEGGIEVGVPILIFGLWFLFTLVVGYHWFRYSHSSLIAFPAVFVHLIISAFIIWYALTGAPMP